MPSRNILSGCELLIPPFVEVQEENHGLKLRFVHCAKTNDSLNTTMVLPNVLTAMQLLLFTPRKPGEHAPTT